MTTYARRLRKYASDDERERGSRPEEAQVAGRNTRERNAARSSPRPGEGAHGSRGMRGSGRTADAAQRRRHDEGGGSDQCGAEIPNDQHVPYIHLDAESGTVDYLEDDEPKLGFELECHRCGTIIQFVTPRCPICGLELESDNADLASLFSDMEFDGDISPEEDCPACGEHVSLADGVCPACGEDVRGNENRVLPVVVKGEDVVFMHLDVMTGELSYLRRLAKQRALDQISLHLEGGSDLGAKENSAPGA